MAFIRKRANGQLSLVFWWNGKSHTKALGTRDEGEAEQIKKDAETQLDRIRKGKAPLASRLLEEGFAISDVLFGSPQIGSRISQAADGETPLPLVELAQAYLAQLPSTISDGHRSGIELWLKHIREFLGDDRPIRSLALADLEAYRKQRIGPDGENTTSCRKEIGILKSAIDWGVENKLLGGNPIPRWPQIRVQRRKRFEWKSDIEAMVESHSFRDDEERQRFLEDMKARMVLTTKDMKDLIKLARQQMPDLALPLMVVSASGVRRKEMACLKKQDFDPRRGTIIVGSAKQSRSEDVTYRTIVLPERVANSLQNHVESLPKAERYLFPVFATTDATHANRWIEWERLADGSFKLDARGKRIPKRDKRGKPIAAKRKQGKDRLRADRAGRLLGELTKGTAFELMSGWHCLRHSFISICVAKGWTWEQIAAVVGHVSRRTTRLYTHFHIDDSKRRMESLEIEF